MDTCLKRIVAYIIDILIVTVVVSAISMIPRIDPYKKDYEKSYNEYLDIVSDAQNENSVDYKDRIIELNYDIYKYRVVSNIISVISLVGYFGILQMVMNGQTVGKKVLKIKVVSNNGKKLNFGNYFLRTLILNNIFFTVINMIAVYILKGSNFYYFTYIVNMLQSTIYMILIIMMVLRKDNRGLHDLLAGTKVIDVESEDVTIIEEKKETIKEKAEKKSKKNSTK